MNNPDESHEAYHEAMLAGQKAYSARVRADGLRGETRQFRCMISPGDSLTLTRIGPQGGQSAHVVLTMSVHGETVGAIMLNPATARRMTAGLLDAIEECDPAVPLLGLPDSLGGDD